MLVHPSNNFFCCLARLISYHHHIAIVTNTIVMIEIVLVVVVINVIVCLILVGDRWCDGFGCWIDKIRYILLSHIVWVRFECWIDKIRYTLLSHIVWVMLLLYCCLSGLRIPNLMELLWVIGGQNSLVVMCWACCAAWCSVVGSILRWRAFFWWREFFPWS